MADGDEPLADAVRDFADRIEDGEYEVTEVMVERPDPGEPGRFRIEVYNRDDFERLRTAMDEHAERD